MGKQPFHGKALYSWSLQDATIGHLHCQKKHVPTFTLRLREVWSYLNCFLCLNFSLFGK